MFDQSHTYGQFGGTSSESASVGTLPGGRQRGCLASFALGCGATLALLLCCGGAALWIWPGFVRYGIDNDLARIERLVSSAEIPDDERAVLLERVAALRTTARDKPIEFVEWMSIFEALKAVADDDRIDPAEVPTLERELTRLEGDLARK